MPPRRDPYTDHKSRCFVSFFEALFSILCLISTTPRDCISKWLFNSCTISIALQKSKQNNVTSVCHPALHYLQKAIGMCSCGC